MKARISLRRERRAVQKYTAAIIDQRIVRNIDIVRIFESKRVTAGTALTANIVVANQRVDRVHRVNANRVIAQTIAFDDHVVAIHQMRAIPPLLDKIIPDDNVVRVPHDNVARLVDVIAFDSNAR